MALYFLVFSQSAFLSLVLKEFNYVAKLKWDFFDFVSLITLIAIFAFSEIQFFIEL